MTATRSPFGIRLPHCMTLLLCAAATVAGAQTFSTTAFPTVYQRPSAEVEALLTATPPPEPLVHARSGKVALLFRQAVIRMDRLARPYLGLAGYRFEPVSRTSSLERLIERIEVIDAWRPDHPKVWQPTDGAMLHEPDFSPDGEFIAALRYNRSGSAQLVIYDTSKGEERLLDVPINPAWGKPCAWSGPRAMICRLLPATRGTPPVRTLGPVVVEHFGSPSPTRTYANLLYDDYDDALFEYYFSAELGRVDIDGRWQRSPNTLGLIKSFEPSPKGEFAIIARLQRPFARLVPAAGFPSSVELWNLERDERLYASRPSGFGLEYDKDVDDAPRRIAWKSGGVPGIGYVEKANGGYRWLSFEEPYKGEPKLIAASDKPFYRFGWTNAGTPYYTLRSEDGAVTQVFIVFDDGPREIWRGRVADRYNNPGRALREDGENGSVLEIDGRIFLAGDGLSPQGPKPFLEAFDLRTRDTTRLFSADDGAYETVLALLDAQGPVLITSRETETQPPSIYRINVKEGKREALRELTNPYPALTLAQRRVISYQRKDGVPLTATLYTPAGWQGDAPLPTLIWIYPYEFDDREHAGQLDVRAFRFHRVKGPSPLAAVLEGYAVLVNPTVPIISGEEGPNDNYLSQLVDSAEAAVSYLVKQGISAPGRIAVGGRSYGAFSSANLLMHSNRFATAIAMSGAYNRTLTPFGFQREKRSFWEATELYTSISPFFHADRVKRPILLVHGGDDPNPGTPTMQARRFFHGLAGYGAHVRYVELPYEGHHYLAKESVLDAAQELIEWLDRTIGPRRPEAEAAAGQTGERAVDDRG